MEWGNVSCKQKLTEKAGIVRFDDFCNFAYRDYHLLRSGQNCPLGPDSAFSTYDATGLVVADKGEGLFHIPQFVLLAH
jgi:hypothetical protein